MTQRTTPMGDTVSAHAGWCPDCDLHSVVVDPRDGASAWAECVECGTGWVHRDDVSESDETARREESQAA